MRAKATGKLDPDELLYWWNSIQFEVNRSNSYKIERSCSSGLPAESSHYQNMKYFGALPREQPICDCPQELKCFCAALKSTNWVSSVNQETKLELAIRNVVGMKTSVSPDRASVSKMHY
jgi:hypothetical protein